jgi:predicted nucleic acid-binding protein
VLEGGQAARFHSRRRLRRCERTVLVVDASVLAPALADDGPDGDAARARLRGQSLVAPELIDLETTSVIRRQLLAGHLDARRARLALTDLVELTLRRVPHRPLLARGWELRENVTVYNAAYIALAELLGVVLVTADARLASAPGPRCQVELLD